MNTTRTDMNTTSILQTATQEHVSEQNEKKAYYQDVAQREDMRPNPSDKYEQIKDIKRLNPVELEAMVLCHEQQIKDIAARWMMEMMEFKRREWVGLTHDDIWWMVDGCTLAGDLHTFKFAYAIEAKLKEKNT